MIHIRQPTDRDFQVETLCGLDLRGVQFSVGVNLAGEINGTGATGEDTRCPDCWRILAAMPAPEPRRSKPEGR